MNPAYGIIMWIIIGALAGWIGSKIMGTDKAKGGIANIIIGVVGAVIGGFVSRAVMGGSHSNGLIVSFLIALVGACVVIAIWKAISRKV